MSQQDDLSIPCSAGCKRTVADEKDALEASWEYLPISARWRCPQCTRELRAANQPKDPTP